MEAYNTIVHTLNNKCEDSKSLTSRRFIHWMSWIFKRRKVKSSIGSCWKQEKYIIDTCTKKYDLVRTTSVLRKTCSVDHYSRREWGQWTFPWFFFRYSYQNMNCFVDQQSRNEWGLWRFPWFFYRYSYQNMNCIAPFHTYKICFTARWNCSAGDLTGPQSRRVLLGDWVLVLGSLASRRMGSRGWLVHKRRTNSRTKKVPCINHCYMLYDT